MRVYTSTLDEFSYDNALSITKYAQSLRISNAEFQYPGKRLYWRVGATYSVEETVNLVMNNIPNMYVLNLSGM